MEDDTSVSGFASIAARYGAPNDVCEKLTAAWPIDIGQTLLDAGHPPGSGLADLERNLERKQPRKLLRTMKQAFRDYALKLLLIGLATTSAALVKMLIPFETKEISHWDTEALPLSLSDTLDGLGVVFEIERSKFTQGVFIRKRIANSGSTEIGSKETHEKLTLIADENSYFVNLPELSEVSVRPESVQAVMIQERNVITIDLELFKPGDSIEFQYLLLSSNASAPRAKLQADRSIEIGIGSPDDRLYDAYQWWVVGLFGLLLISYSAKNFFVHLKAVNWKRDWFDETGNIVQTLIGLVLLASFGGVAVTYLVVVVVRFVWL